MYKSKNDADEAVSVVSLTSSSGEYINGRNSANLELLIDKTSSIFLYVKLKALASGYTKIRLIRSLKKFIFQYQDLVEIYSVSAEKIIKAMHFHILKMYKDKEVKKCQGYFFINRQNRSTTGKL
jgi:hypothetical protein